MFQQNLSYVANKRIPFIRSRILPIAFIIIINVIIIFYTGPYSTGIALRRFTLEPY